MALACLVERQRAGAKSFLPVRHIASNPGPSSPPDLRPSGRASSRRSQIRWRWGPGFEASASQGRVAGTGRTAGGGPVAMRTWVRGYTRVHTHVHHRNVTIVTYISLSNGKWRRDAYTYARGEAVLRSFSISCHDHNLQDEKTWSWNLWS